MQVWLQCNFNFIISYVLNTLLVMLYRKFALRNLTIKTLIEDRFFV